MGVEIKQGFFEKLTNEIHLDYVLKALGVILFALAFFNAWGSLSFLHKAGFAVAPVMWFVGAHFTRIYK